MFHDLRRIATRVRIPSTNWNPLYIPYIPLGFIIVLFRLFILCHLYVSSALLAAFPTVKQIYLRAVSLSLGFVVTVEYKNTNRLVQNFNDSRAIVSNFVSLFDHLLIDMVTSSYTNSSQVFRWAFRSAPENVAVSSSDLLAWNKRKNGYLHIFPEQLPTGSCEDMLRWKSQCLQNVTKVHPVAIHVHRHFPVSYVVYPIDWRFELFWQLFTPFTCYHLEFLPPVEKGKDEALELFVARIQSQLSENLRARSLTCTAEDLLSAIRPMTSVEVITPPPDYATRQREHSATSSHGVRRRQVPPSSHAYPRPITAPSLLEQRIQQVLEVLPHANLQKVKQAVAQTEDVHAAIASLLDNSLDDDDSEEVGGNIVGEPSVAPSPKANFVEPSSYRAAASTFGQSADVRQMSFVQRKKLFIENARQAYLMKHKSMP